MTSGKQFEIDRRPRLVMVAAAIVGVLLIWSGIEPNDRTTWAMEVAPVFVAFAVLGGTWRRFPMTWLAYICVALHCVILCVGGKYTYAQVPIGDWFKDVFDLSRNHYDRLGHVAQGFFPAILARELLLRTSPLVRGKWLSFIVVAICLAISAFYEFIEWWVALISGEGADAFLATQGDVWDTQWDMCLAMCGAIVSLLLLSRVHNRALGLKKTENAGTPNHNLRQ